MYIDDPVFDEVVDTEEDARTMAGVEGDIQQAITFLRFRQNDPDMEDPAADLDYNSVEY